jgi:sec-independent protein translocase protein TatB
MFDIGPTELLLIVVVAVIAIGPKDLPLALRTAGRWIGQMRKLSSHFRTGLDAMIREAEMQELEQKWKEQNEKIMREHPNGVAEPEPAGAYPPVQPTPTPEPPPPPASAEGRAISVDNPDEYRDMPSTPAAPAADEPKPQA